MKVAAFAGSLREGSYNKQLLRAVIALAPPALEISELSLSDIPLYNKDVEVQGTPEPVLQFKEVIGQSAAVIIITPEYSHTIPGVLKNALDWASREQSTDVFDQKPVAIGGATTGSWGTARSQLNIRLTLGAMGSYVMPRPHLYVPKAGQKFTGGKLTDAATTRAVKAWLDGVQEFFSIFNRSEHS